MGPNITEPKIPLTPGQIKLDNDTKSLFQSRTINDELQSIILGISAKYGSKRNPSLSTEFSPKTDTTAYTSGDHIHENLGHDLILDGKTLNERYCNAVGMLVHEMAHVCYTDCKGRTTFLENLQKGIFPSLDKTGKSQDWCNNYDNLLDDIKKLGGNSFAELLATYENILEDGYIENKFLNSFTGSTPYALKVLRAGHLASMPSAKQLNDQIQENPKDLISPLMNATLELAKFGDIKECNAIDLKNSNIYALMQSSIPYIQNTLSSNNASARRISILEAFVASYGIIRDQLLNPPTTPPGGGGGGGKPEVIILPPGATPPQGGSGGGKGGQGGSGTPDPNAPIIIQLGGSGGGAGGKSQPLSPQQQQAVNDALQKLDQQIKDQLKNQMTQQSNSSLDPLDSSQLDNKSQSPNSTNGGGSSGSSKKTKDGSQGGSGKNSASTELNGRDADALQKLLKAEQKDKADNKADQDLMNSLLKNNNSSGGGYGNSWDMESVRINTVPYLPSSKDLYLAKYAKFAERGKRLADSIKERIQAYGQGEILQNQLQGDLDIDSTIDAIIEDEKTYFSKYINPDERAPANIAICIDVSGSMSGNRLESAKKAAIMLDSCCNELGLHDLVLAFENNIHKLVNLDRVRNTRSDNDAYKIATINASGGTNDWQTLEFVSSKLEQESTLGKIIFFITDAETYGEGMQRSIKNAQNKGCTFIPVAVHPEIQARMIEEFDMLEKDVPLLTNNDKDIERFGDKFVEELNNCVDKFFSE